MAEPKEKEDQVEPELKNGMCTCHFVSPQSFRKTCVYAMCIGYVGEIKGIEILFAVPAALE